MEIKPIGRYLPQDAQGYLQKDVAWEKVSPLWRPLIEEVKTAYLDRLGDTLHSIYLRGSVAAGSQVNDLSDLDTFALVTTQGCPWKELDWGNFLKDKWKKSYPFATDVEGAVSSVDAEGRLENVYLQAILKLESLCIWGEDIGEKLPQYRPGRALARNYRWLTEDCGRLFSEEVLEVKDCRSILKTLLRAGFELVMEREKLFTTDLYPAYRSFSKYYPEWEKEMRQVLLYYLEVPSQKQVLRGLATGLGEWMIAESGRVFENR